MAVPSPRAVASTKPSASHQSEETDDAGRLGASALVSFCPRAVGDGLGATLLVAAGLAAPPGPEEPLLPETEPELAISGELLLVELGVAEAEDVAVGDALGVGVAEGAGVAQFATPSGARVAEASLYS